MIIKKIYDISLYQCEQGDLTNSYIFAVGDFQNKAELHTALIKGQTIAEHAMLDFPVVVHLLAAGREIENDSMKLFENVKLLEQSDWDIADESEIFLMNERMWRLCKGGDTLCGLDISTADELRDLFKKEACAMVAVQLA